MALLFQRGINNAPEHFRKLQPCCLGVLLQANNLFFCEENTDALHGDKYSRTAYNYKERARGIAQEVSRLAAFGETVRSQCFTRPQ